jgi:hypothetical protein
MGQVSAVTVSCAVEGTVDEAVVRKVVAEAGLDVGTVYGRQGKQFLLQRVDGWNRAAGRGLWLVLVDLDQDYDCAPPALQAWLPRRASGMNLRVAVRSVEAWLLADRDRFARFIGVSRTLIPRNPEVDPDPKRTVVGLASRSHKTRMREDLVPRPRSGRSEGELYVSRMIEYVHTHWRPRIAAETAHSLRRCLGRLDRLAQKGEC